MANLIETVRGLETKGVGFRSLTEGLDTMTPGGTLIFHVFGALAQFERDSRADARRSESGGGAGAPRWVQTCGHGRQTRTRSHTPCIGIDGPR